MASFQDIWNEMREAEQLPCVLLDVAGLERGFAQLPAAAFSSIECLFTGDLADELRDVAPYLARAASFELPVRDALAALLKTQVAALVELADPATTFAHLHRHLRKFNLAYNAAGNPRFFRYYDARLMLQMLTKFNADKRKHFFGPISRFTFFRQERATQPGVFVRCQCSAGGLLITTRT